MPTHPSRDRDPANVLDHHTGKVRVLARRCATCIFRTEDPMHLGDDRTRQVIDDNLRAGALLTCHATLPYGEHPNFGPAVCAGFWARHRNQVPAGRLAQLFLGTTRVQPPEGDDPHQPAAPADQSEEQLGTQVAGCSARRGSRIRLVAISDPYTDLEPGALGTVTRIDDLGTLTVRWDDGHTLGLIPGLDQFDLL